MATKDFQIKHPSTRDLIFNLAVISKSVVFVDQKVKQISESHDLIHRHRLLAMGYSFAIYDSRTHTRNRPAITFTPVEEAIVQSAHSSLPELDLLRQQCVSAPERGTGD